jgi:excisionase family DNA binding protein
MPENLTTDEAAELLRIRPQTLRMWRHAGRGPRSFKIGARVLYAETDVRAFIEAARAGSDPDAA